MHSSLERPCTESDGGAQCTLLRCHGACKDEWRDEDPVPPPPRRSLSAVAWALSYSTVCKRCTNDSTRHAYDSLIDTIKPSYLWKNKRSNLYLVNTKCTHTSLRNGLYTLSKNKCSKPNEGYWGKLGHTRTQH